MCEITPAMPLTDAGQRDPAMVGSSGYERNPLDFYPTPNRAIQSLLSIIEDDLPSFLVWEPFCGNGAISTVMKPLARECVSTDIRAYEGFDPDGLFDFFELRPAGARKCSLGAPVRWSSMDDIAKLKGFMPDVIITNPPYGKDAERAARHALALMEAQKGMVIFLCRNEWDCSKNRRDLFDHPAFMGKVVLRHRPRWIKGSTGAPRHNYAWFIWSWAKALTAPNAKAEILYAA